MSTPRIDGDNLVFTAYKPFTTDAFEITIPLKTIEGIYEMSRGSVCISHHHGVAEGLVKHQPAIDDFQTVKNLLETNNVAYSDYTDGGEF